MFVIQNVALYEKMNPGRGQKKKVNPDDILFSKPVGLRSILSCCSYRIFSRSYIKSSWKRPVSMV